MQTQTQTHPELRHPTASSAPTCCRRTVYFTGRVQGVGFRYTTRNIALQYAVSGFVRNLPDGRVELVMEGREAEMDQVIADLKRRMSGFVRQVTIEPAPATGEFDHFAIRH